MITIHWSLLVLITIILIGLVWVFTLDNRSGLGGSARALGCLLWFVLTIIAVLIYGGIFWW